MNPSPVTDAVRPDPQTKEIELAARRELVLGATDIASEVIGAEVSIPELTRIAESTEVSHAGRLTAKRGLRFLSAVATPDSRLMATVSESDLYHAGEAMIVFGASESRYCALVEDGLSPAEATGLYALRTDIEDMTDDSVSFTSIRKALSELGVSASTVCNNPDAAMVAFDMAGYFVQRIGKGGIERIGFRPEEAARIARKAEERERQDLYEQAMLEEPELDLDA